MIDLNDGIAETLDKKFQRNAEARQEAQRAQQRAQDTQEDLDDYLELVLQMHDVDASIEDVQFNPEEGIIKFRNEGQSPEEMVEQVAENGEPVHSAKGGEEVEAEDNDTSDE